MGTVFVVHLSHLDDQMILKLLLLCSLFLLTASQEDDDAGQETAEDDSASQPISSEEDQDSEENAASQTNSSVVVGGNRAIGRSAKGLRWGWSSWCYYNGCPADHYGTVHPQCCTHSYHCGTHTASCRSQINQINHYYRGMAQLVWVWCAATGTHKSMLQMLQPQVVNKDLLALGSVSNEVRVTLCKCSAGTWDTVRENVAVGQLTTGQFGQPNEYGQIEHARYGYVADQFGQVTPTCTDLAVHARAHCPRAPAPRSQSMVTLASWDLKWCWGRIGRNWGRLTLKAYGGCCWHHFYRKERSSRGQECYWTAFG